MNWLPILMISVGVFIFGTIVGSDWVKDDWQKEKLEYKTQLNSAKDQIKDLILTHSIKENNLITQMNEEKDKYEKSLIFINNDYTSRLRQSEERATAYRNQANNQQGCISLAEHTSKLDSALERGLSVVRKLSEAIKLQRTVNDRLLQIIQNDRELLSHE